MADVQIVSAKDVPAPSTYVIPKRAELVLKAVNAQFTDNGATGDWLPAVVILSDSGDVIARAADQAVLVARGDDAEVSWFPGVKNAAAASPGMEVATVQLGGVSPVVNNTVTPVVWGGVSFSSHHSGVPFGFKTASSGGGLDLQLIADAIYWYTVIVPWASFAGDRYVELSVPGVSGVELPTRARSATTPADDLQVLSGVFEHSGAGPDTVTVNLYQNSGANQNLNLTGLGVCMVMVYSPYVP